MMVSFKIAVLSAAALAMGAVAAKAEDLSYSAPARQVQAPPSNSGIPYSYARLPGPKASPSNWIPSSYAVVDVRRECLCVREEKADENH